VIITRYLAREISKPFVPTLGILIVLFASFNVAAFLAQAANGLLPATTIATMVALKVLISLEVLIPIALYVSVFLALSRLHSDQEFVAMLALRITPGRVSWAVFGLSACLAVAVGGLSLVARPWAYQKLHQIADQDEVTVDVDAMNAGTFYEGMHGNRVIFLTGRQGHGAPAQDVFVRRRLGDHMEVIHAKMADLLPKPDTGQAAEVRLSDAHIYEIGGDDGKQDHVVGAGGLFVSPDAQSKLSPDYSAVAATTAHIARSRAPEDAAEFQWRLSTPLSTLLLGMLGLLMSRPKPKQGKNGKFAAMILIYFVYDMLFTSARTWVQHGTIAVFPGIWWVPALLSLFLLIALYGPNRGSGWQRA
jgi:lipopolysaccharide export system permease protein